MHFQGNRLTVEQNIKEGTWNCKIPHINPNRAISLEIKNATEVVNKAQEESKRIEELANSIKKAVEMPVSEQITRNSILQKRLKRYNVHKWANDFMNSLIITIPTTIITLFISSMSGFTLAIHKFKFNMFIFAMFVRQKNNKHMLIFQYSIGTVFVDDLPITLETAVGLFSRMTSGNNHRKK